jgi:hypothetical protein
MPWGTRINWLSHDEFKQLCQSTREKLQFTSKENPCQIHKCSKVTSISSILPLFYLKWCINTLYLEGNLKEKSYVKPYSSRQINIPTLPTLVPITWAIGLWVLMKCEIRDCFDFIFSTPSGKFWCTSFGFSWNYCFKYDNCIKFSIFWVYLYH